MSSGQEKTGAVLICDWLVAMEVSYVFCVPSLYIYPLVKEITRHPKLQLIVATHELGAGYMADGYARAGAQFGVCLVAGGPGASNLLTSAVTSCLDNTPMLYLSSDVDVKLSGRGAFQDVGDTGTKDVALFKQAVSFSQAVTNINVLEENLSQVAAVLRKRGTAHLTLPTNIFSEKNSGNLSLNSVASLAQCSHDGQQATIDSKLIAYLSQARKILVYVGRRVATNEGMRHFQELVETFCLPVVTSLDAKSMLPENHPLVIGNVGYGGNSDANEVFTEQEFDLLLCVGIDLNEKNLLEKQQELRSNNRHIIHLDQQKNSFRSLLEVDETIIVENLAKQLQLLSQAGKNQLHSLILTAKYRADWLTSLSLHQVQDIAQLVTDFSDNELLKDIHIIPILHTYLAENSILYPDSGSSRILAGQSWQSLTSRSFFSATTTAPTGWAIAAGIGGKLAKPDDRTIVLTGDISMLMHGLELVTAVRYGLAIPFFVLDNGGDIRALRANRSDPDIYPVSQTLTMNWAQFAQSMGMNGVTVSTVGELKDICQNIQSAAPILIHIKLSSNLKLNKLDHSAND